MRRCLCMTVLVLVSVCFAAAAEVVDRIVASVGTEVILQSELMQELAPALDELRKTATDESDFTRMANEQLERLLEQSIDSKILLREALLAGLNVTDDDVEARIADIKKRFPSEDDFLKELQAAGETMSDFRSRIKKQIMAIAMGIRKRQEFEKGIEVTETDIAQYFQDHPEEFSRPERVHLKRIFLKVGDAAELAAAKARMAEISGQLKAGGDFAELARTHSTGPEASSGGEVGWVSRGDLVDPLDEAAFSLPEGGVSDPLETSFGLVLLKVEKKEGAGSATLDEVRAQIEPKIRAQQAEVRFGKWMSELRKRSRVRVYL